MVNFKRNHLLPVFDPPLETGDFFGPHNKKLTPALMQPHSPEKGLESVRPIILSFLSELRKTNSLFFMKILT
jgi:hypothetical protein